MPKSHDFIQNADYWDLITVYKVKVTIGLCVKNCENTIRETIYSIIAQDFPAKLMELIIVDGCSIDKTVKIIKNCLSRASINYRILYENKGLGFARQIVVNKAQGDYIVWVDGDVIISKDYIRKMVNFMDSNPYVGIAAGKHEIYQVNNLVAALEDVPYVVVDNKYKGRTWSRLPGTAGSIYRVKAIKEVGGFDVNLKGVGEDIEAAQRVLKAGWIVYRGVDAAFYERRLTTWKSLWDHYVWYGYGAYSVIKKDAHIIKLYEMLPISGFLAGIWYSTIAYKLKGKKCFFLLPFHYAFKRIAWCLGFVRAYFQSKAKKLMRFSFSVFLRRFLILRFDHTR